MKNVYHTIIKWFVSSDTLEKGPLAGESEKIEWLRVFPFALIHLGCLLVIWVGFSWVALLMAFTLFLIRGVSISAFYHRYFSHRAFKTSRVCQFIFAVMGAMAMQKGPLWWVSYHRNHHEYPDQAQDVHSPVVHGFFWSHIGWILSNKNFFYDHNKVKDLMRFPELILVERFYFFIPLVLALALYLFGLALQHSFPSLGTSGWQMVVWGFFISTIVLFHTTAAVNSLTHQFGHRPFVTKDNSRNNAWLALITWGEGWHNNHHYFPASARIGFKWWEVDITYYFLKLMEKMGIIWDLRAPPIEAFSRETALKNIPSETIQG